MEEGGESRTKFSLGRKKEIKPENENEKGKRKKEKKEKKKKKKRKEAICRNSANSANY